MKLPAVLSLLACAAVAWGQASHFGAPSPGQQVVAGTNITVQIIVPVSIEGSTNVGLAIGLLFCPNTSLPCPTPDEQLGDLLFVGNLDLTGQAPGERFENFSLQIPSIAQDVELGRASIGYARLHLIGAGPSPILETNNVTIEIVAPASAGTEIKTGRSSAECVTAPTNANGGAVVIELCDGSASQAWTQKGSTFVIYGNMCLDVTNGSTANGNKMQIWECFSGNTNQEFSVTADNRIAWTNKGECLDLTNGVLTSGNPIQMWKCTDNDDNQVWDLVS